VDGVDALLVEGRAVLNNNSRAVLLPLCRHFLFKRYHS